MVKKVRVPVDMLTLEGKSALALAAEHRHPDAVEALLALGANPNLRQKNGPIIQTALFNWPDVGEQTPESMEASRRCVRLLIAAGADVRYRPRKHDWPCLSPAVQHDLELTRMLLEAGADYDASSTLGFPLLHACQEGRVDTAKALLEQGATVNQRTSDGWSAVLWAAAHGPDFTRMLLDAGADPRSMTDDGFNLVWAACRSAQDDEADTMVDALVRGAERAGARVEVIAAGQQEDTALATLRLVIAAGADPLARMDGKTPLQDKSIPEALRAVIADASGKPLPAKRARR
jgi:ankyrin repeat protein